MFSLAFSRNHKMFLRKLKYGIQQIRCKYTFARINQIDDKRLGESFNIKGWVRANRQMKKFAFVDVNDGSTGNNLQVVLDKSMMHKVSSIAYGASLSVSGKLSQTPKGQLELHAEDVQLIGGCPSAEDGYPFVRNQKHPPEHVRQFMHMRTRVSSVCSMLRVRHAAAKAFHRYLDEAGFIQTQAPVLTSNDCEGAGEIFVVKPDSDELLKSMKKEIVPVDQAFFDQKTYLTVSGQLHLEALVNHLSAVYTFGPTFRSENSVSPHHLAEFTMLEAEEAFVDSTEHLAARIDGMVREVTKTLLNTCETDLRHAGEHTESQNEKFNWVDREFPRLTYAEACRILTENAGKLKNPLNAATGLNREQELFLVKYVQGPLFVIDWPRELKAFYMRQSASNPEVVEALDFLVPSVGELVGGSLREDDIDRLESKLPSDNLKWYLELRKCGNARSAGFGLGFERYVQMITGIPNIREAIPFPRWPHHCSL